MVNCTSKIRQKVLSSQDITEFQRKVYLELLNVAADGSLCGFAGKREGEMIEKKRRLLELEKTKE